MPIPRFGGGGGGTAAEDMLKWTFSHPRTSWRVRASVFKDAWKDVLKILFCTWSNQHQLSSGDLVFIVCVRTCYYHP